MNRFNARVQWHFSHDFKKNPKIDMEPQKTPNSKRNPEKEE